MPNPRPKILTRFDVPTGGWDMDLVIHVDGDDDGDLSSGTEAIEMTIPAGSYYVAFDHQDDDFVRAFLDAALTALDTGATHANYNSASWDGKPVLTLANNGRVDIQCAGHDMRFDWTTKDGASIAGVLGFDASAVTDYIGVVVQGAEQHDYGWYSDEDGQLASLLTEDAEESRANQSRSLSSQVQTHFVSRLYGNVLSLQFLSRAKTWSGGTAYAGVPAHPYRPSVALENWWGTVRDGRPFRVYRDGHPRLDATGELMSTFEHSGIGSSPPPDYTTWEDTSKAWETAPQELAGKIIVNAFASTARLIRRYIVSNTATTVTLANDFNNLTSMSSTDPKYWIVDHRYRTYVVDLGSMRGFAPREIPGLDKFNIEIPLMKYVS